MADPDPPRICRLVGVYNASGTVLGELSYLVRSRIGSAHCALCDITHGSIREKAGWKACRDSLAVPFETVHLNERDADLVELTDGHTPCVVAETDHGSVILLESDDLTSCDGSPERLVDAVVAAAADRGLPLQPSA
jgi:hypothetical protein